MAHHLDEQVRHDVVENIAVLCRACHMRFHKSKNAALRASMTSRWKTTIASLLKE